MGFPTWTCHFFVCRHVRCVAFIRCLEEGIVDTPHEADMALIFGIGFPPFFGGALHYADLLGLDKVCAMADKYAHLGKLYEPTAKMREMAASGATYYNK